MDDGDREVWLTISAAAEAAGVARRTAFRWADAGLIPIRGQGRSRLVAVGALKALATKRGSATPVPVPRMPVPRISADVKQARETGGPPLTQDQEALESLTSWVPLIAEQVDALWLRFERLERTLGHR